MYVPGSVGVKSAVRPAADASRPRGPSTTFQRIGARAPATRPSSSIGLPATARSSRPAPTSGALAGTVKRTVFLRVAPVGRCTVTRSTLRPWRRPWLIEASRVRVPRRVSPKSLEMSLPFRRAVSVARSPARTRSFAVPSSVAPLRGDTTSRPAAMAGELTPRKASTATVTTSRGRIGGSNHRRRGPKWT